MNDIHYDRLLNIKTTGEQQGFYESHHYNRYEATSYLALESLFKEYNLQDVVTEMEIKKVLDKGKILFILHQKLQTMLKQCLKSLKA